MPGVTHAPRKGTAHTFGDDSTRFLVRLTWDSPGSGIGSWIDRTSVNYEYHHSNTRMGPSHPLKLSMYRRCLLKRDVGGLQMAVHVCGGVHVNLGNKAHVQSGYSHESVESFSPSLACEAILAGLIQENVNREPPA